MDDDALIAAVAAGDDTALRALFSRHAPWLAARLRSLLSAADVEDVLQETFLAVWRGAGNYRPEGAAGGWLWGVARRQAALFLRRRGPAELVLPAVTAADRQHAADPAEAALSRPSAVSGAAAAVTFGWLVPMTAVCALALAAATLSQSANVGVAAGISGWAIMVLAGQSAAGQLTAAITHSSLFLPYLAFAACCGAVVSYATRIPRGAS
jgi:hypothetical protein